MITKVSETKSVIYFPTVLGFKEDGEGTVTLVRDNGLDPRGDSAPFWRISLGPYDLGSGLDTMYDATWFINLNQAPTLSGYGFKGLDPRTMEVRKVRKTVNTITDIEELIFPITVS